MTKYRRQSAGPKKGAREMETVPGSETEGDNKESCRCKEVAKKTPREMLRLMLSDLTFWKKAKGRK